MYGRVCRLSGGSDAAYLRREVGEVLSAAGASWNDVVSMTTYHVDFHRDIELMTEIHRGFVTKEPFPAWTAVGVTQFYSPDAVVEISVTALVPRELQPGRMMIDPMAPGRVGCLRVPSPPGTVHLPHRHRTWPVSQLVGSISVTRPTVRP
jgi:Endoribonuclease L-PSP